MVSYCSDTNASRENKIGTHTDHPIQVLARHITIAKKVSSVDDSRVNFALITLNGIR